jgi:hypothetical protein
MWVDNIKMDQNEGVWTGFAWLILRLLVNVVMNLLGL